MLTIYGLDVVGVGFEERFQVADVRPGASGTRQVARGLRIDVRGDFELAEV